MTATDANRIARDWNAGESGCGALIVGLKREIGELRDGDLLRVTALDPGARVDLPAWCRMTGHTLVRSTHPVYVIARSGGRVNP